MGQIINGSNVAVKFGTAGSEAPIACSTSCTVDINQELKEVVCKGNNTDAGWKGVTPKQKSWTMSIDNLYVINTETNEASWSDVVDAIINATEVSVIFEATDDAAASGETEKYTLTGKAYVESTSLTAPAEEDSTFSVTLTGNGKLTAASVDKP